MKCDCNRGIVGGQVCEKCEGTTFITESEPEVAKKEKVTRVVKKRK